MRKDVGDKDHLKVFATQEAAEIPYDPEGVAFEYPEMNEPDRRQAATRWLRSWFS